MTDFPEGPVNEEQMAELEKTKEGLRHYFITVARKNFIAGNKLPPGKEKKVQLSCALTIYKYLDEFVESCYKPKEKEMS